MGKSKMAALAAAVVAAGATALLIAPGSSAAAGEQSCDAEPAVVSEDSATDLLPTARRLVITQASCSGPSDSEETPLDVVVRVRPVGDRQYVAAVVQAAMIQRSGGGETIRQAIVDGIPLGGPGTEVCVDINGEERCIGGS